MRLFDRLRRSRLPALALVATAGILAGLWFLGSAADPRAGEEVVTVYIPRGAPFAQVVNLLEQNGLVRSRLLFRVMGYVSNAPSESRRGNTS